MVNRFVSLRRDNLNTWPHFSMFSKRMSTVLFVIIALSFLLSQIPREAEATADPEDFGMPTTVRTIKRPLLTILLDFSDIHFSPDHTPAFYRELLFGTPSFPVKPNIAGRNGLLSQGSGGLFRFSDAGVLGPFTNPDDPSTRDVDESQTDCARGLITGCVNVVNGGWKTLGNAIKLASDAGFNFAKFDTNNDRKITQDELIILVISVDFQGDALTTSNPYWDDSVSIRESYRFVRREGYLYPPGPPRPGNIPLVSWWDPDRVDNFATANRLWSGRRDVTRAPNYRFVREEGYIIRPDASSPPPGSVPLYSWWSPARTDNLLTSDPAWAGAPGETRLPDYQFVRKEGYVYTSQEPGTIPLFRWMKIISGGTTTGTAPSTVRVSGGVDVELSVSVVGETKDLRVPAHELAHAVSGKIVDIYGASGCMSGAYSLMSGACGGVKREARNISNLDPFLKMSAGWLRPKIISAPRTGQSQTLEIAAAELPRLNGKKAYLIYDPERGTDEFFILEHRYRASNPLPVAKPGKAALYSWWSPSREDNFITTDPKWAGQPGDSKTSPEYKFVRLEGYVDSGPHPGKIPFYLWWNPTEKDNFLTSSPLWASERPGQTRGGYTFVRKEGFIDHPTASSDGQVALYTWWSPSRMEYFTTTHPRWAGRRGDRKPPDYEFFRMEGYVESPIAGLTDGSVPLYHWYDQGRKDHISTSDPGWWGSPGDTRTNYVFVRLLGFVSTPAAGPPTGKIPLYLWWNSSIKDNYLTSDPAWDGETTGTSRDGYVFVRKEGYITSPSSTPQANQAGLYTWRYARTGGHLTVSNPAWASETPGERKGDWVFVRKEGYIEIGVEYNYDGDTWGTGEGGLRDDGLAIWHVLVNHKSKKARVIPVDKAAGSSLIGLNRWWNKDREDNFTTSQPGWAWSSVAQHEDYDHVRLEGYIFPLTSGGACRTGIPLYLWWSLNKADNYITSDPEWAPARPGQIKGEYRFARKEGCIVPPDAYDAPAAAQPSNMKPLFTWRKGNGKDFFTTSSSDWASERPGEAKGEYVFVRKEGYVKSGGGEDLSNYLIPPNGNPGVPSGNGLWQKRDGGIYLKWYDGSESGILVSVESEEVNVPVIRVKISKPR